jgi:deazaflavin-dependent oxidoreductase (nitroreductase family)
VSTPHPANRSYFTPSGRLLTWITKIHRGVYRATFGVLGATVPQRAEAGAGWLLRPLSMLLLTTTGRRSGMRRTVPLPYYSYDGRTFLVASFAGGDKHPAWYLNLADQPEVEVQIRWRKLKLHAVTLSGDERARYWQMLVDDWPRYRIYQAGTQRTIPLVELKAGSPTDR